MTASSARSLLAWEQCSTQLVKHEYDIEALKGYIGTYFTLSCLVMLATILSCLYIFPLHTRMFTLVSGLLSNLLNYEFWYRYHAE